MIQTKEGFEIQYESVAGEDGGRESGSIAGEVTSTTMLQKSNQTQETMILLRINIHFHLKLNYLK